MASASTGGCAAGARLGLESAIAVAPRTACASTPESRIRLGKNIDTLLETRRAMLEGACVHGWPGLFEAVNLLVIGVWRRHEAGSTLAAHSDADDEDNESVYSS